MQPDQHIASLEQRKARLEDLRAIRRLQCAYAYYLDQGLWDEAAALFAEDGSIEHALDGVYIGRERVRQYLYALGGGRAGLAPGELNAHIPIMPVITLAADGRSARGTWRELILAGQPGRGAYWGEGPYENEYVKVDGFWKIRRLHWFQTLFVPYEGGWARHEDLNGGRWVADELPPDAPPTFTYRPWPGTFTPPFHFRSTEAPPAPGSHAATPPLERPDGSGSEPDLRTLALRAARLAREVQCLQDQEEIENLQQMYGYYIDKGMWTQAASLFSTQGVLEIEGRGAWIGRRRILEYFRAIGPEGPVAGRLFDHMQLQPIVHVAPHGRTARGRWRLFAQLARHGDFHEWGLGVYENEYTREGGSWKLARLHLYPTLYTPYEMGWGRRRQTCSRFEPELPPDRPPDATHSAERAPFHYPNPARAPRATNDVGAAAEHEKTAAALRDWADIEALLHRVGQQLARLEDVAEIRNLQGKYGYYLATLEWDALAELFARQGTIEIALRGVYVGKASVRRSLELYGRQGLDEGVLHNHMQLQPVIHVADDGSTARIRSRAFSMMGYAGRSAMWMGGVYENELVREDGTWKFSRDHAMNTYFAPYEVGWKELAPRAPPGISESNPPDRPPTLHFEMYPGSFLPPYHYPDPVVDPADEAPMRQGAAGSHEPLASATSSDTPRVSRAIPPD